MATRLSIRKPFFFIAVVFPFFVLPASYALDPGKAVTQYDQDVWQIEQGLPQNSVQAIVQTRDGYLWLGTQEGLVRFDGVRFKIVEAPSAQQNNVQALLEDRDGSLWIGTYNGGLNCLKNGKITNYGSKDGLSNETVFSIYQDREGAIWIGTAGGGLNRFKDRRFTAYDHKDGLSNDTVRTVYQDRTGTLWIGTEGGGLNRFDGSKFTAYTTDDGLSNDTVRCIYEDRKGNLWVGTEGGGLNHFKDGTFTTYRMKDGLSNDQIRSIFEDRDGCLWIGTYGGGLNRFQNSKFTAFTSADGLSNDQVRSIFEDREGSLWIGTEGGGLNRLRQGKFTTYTVKEGLSENTILSIYQDREGSLWIGTAGGGLNRFKDGKFTTFSAEQGLSNKIVSSICEDHEGTLWIGTYGGGLNRFKDGQFTAYTTKQGLANDFVLSVYEDQEQNLWIGARGGGLTRFKDGKFTGYDSTQGLSNNQVRFIYEDRAKNLWIGTAGGGLSLFKDGKFTNFTTKQGLSSDQVWSIYQDREGTLWIGTYGGGLNRFRDGKFTSYTTKEGLFSDFLFQILEDSKGNLWMSCNKGIFRVSKQNINEFDGGKIRSIPSVSYGTADGMKSRECNGGMQPAGWKSRDGKLWFPTIKGVVVIDAENIKTNAQPPPVLIEEILVDDQFLPGPVGATYGSSLPPGDGKFEFRYTALSFLGPDRVRFKYKMTGFDKEWVDAGIRRIAYYTNIPPGDYRFQVVACNNDGIWNTTGSSFQFSLAPHFYRTTWFYVLVGATVLLTAAGGYRVRVRRLKAGQMELVSLVGERTKDLSAEKEKTERALLDAENMLKQIRDRDEALQRAHDELEKRVEERTKALQSSETRYRSIIQNLEDGYYEADLNGNLIFANEALSGILQYSRDELLGMNDRQFTNPENAKKLYKMFREVYATGNRIRALECEIIRKDGSRWSVEVSGSVIKDFSDCPVGFRGVVRDVTERKKAEAELRESETRFRSVVQSAPDAIILADSKGNIVSWNQSARNMFGYSEGEVLGRPLTLLMPERYREPHIKGLERLRATGESRILGKTLELFGLRKNGSEFPLELSLATWETAQERFYGGIIHDTTNRKKAEEELRKAREMEVMGRLVSGVAHEVRTPLFVISTSAETLSKKLGDLPETTAILAQVDRLSNLTKDLLEMGRPSWVLQKWPQNIHNLIEATVAHLESSLPQARGRVNLSLPENSIQVMGDREKLIQVFLNILQNAVQHSPDESSSIEVTAEELDSGVYVRIRDGGSGIPPEQIDRIFEPFFSLRKGGVGLGLSIAKRILEIHGGKIRALNNDPDPGCTFVVHLPRFMEEGL